jgi:hypothetical protein
MLHNHRKSFQSARSYVSPSVEARRLRLEYNRLQRRLDALRGHDGTEPEADSAPFAPIPCMRSSRNSESRWT